MSLTWTLWREKNFPKMQSPFEKAFATNILAHVPGLSPSDVHCQYPFVGEDGQELHMDFAIIITDHVKIAIEINGRDKTGTGLAKSSQTHDHDEMRVRVLSRQGWKVIHYSNNDFSSREITVRSQIALDIEEARMRVERGQVEQKRVATPESPPAAPSAIPSASVIHKATPESKKRKISALGVTLIAVGSAIVLGLIIFGVLAVSSPPGNLANPGNTKDCSDFATQREAQAWFDKYYDRFGDVAELDGDGDGIVGEGGCTSG